MKGTRTVMEDRAPPRPPSDIDRFVDAQASVYDRVVEELRDGRKATHWMWFVFPQLVGLGHSAMAAHYGIKDIEEAQRYLAHPVLGERLRHCVHLMRTHEGKSARAILGTPDDLKFRSCLTLFLKASSAAEDRALFTGALAQFYGGAPDQRTLDLLG